MQLTDIINQKVKSLYGIQRTTNPQSKRLTFINDKDKIQLAKIQENKIWFYGDSNELLNYYTEANVVSFFNNPIFNRNNRNFFWSLSTNECHIKRVHSGIPNAIATTLSNIIGYPDINVKLTKGTKTDNASIDCTKVWDEIAEVNDFKVKLTQQARPLTEAIGYGALKININKELVETPLIEFYDAEDCEYIYDCGIIVGIVFKTYYTKGKDENYLLLEYRYKKNKTSYIDYELYKMYKAENEVEQVPIGTLPELANLENKSIANYNKIFAVPMRYFYDAINQKFGRSIYDGKVDLFDDLDQILSQDSQTVRVSTPVEYYSPDVIDRGPNGQIGVPSAYNRQFIQKAGVPDGDGNMSEDIITTQPDLNFDKYSADALSKLDFILTGVLSPATLGIDVAKKDNAEAQREKEKITIQTRNNIIAAETKILKQLIELCLDMQEYIAKGVISTDNKYDITIKYNEFANPSFENELQILGPSWINGEISTEKYVELLWGDKLSDEDRQKEIDYLNKQRQSEDMDLESLMGGINDKNVSRNGQNTGLFGQTEE